MGAFFAEPLFRLCLVVYIIDICLLALYGLHSLLQAFLFGRQTLGKSGRSVLPSALVAQTSVKIVGSESPLSQNQPPGTRLSETKLPETRLSESRLSESRLSESRLPETNPQQGWARNPWPRVTIQLPIYNERHVAQRLIRAVAAMDWPSHRLQIQVLDDSTDDTTQQIQATVAELKAARNLAIEHHHRRDRSGFKAGALHQGLATATGEFVAIFDADFIPEPDFLKRTVPAFQNPEVGCVQARWGHLNANTSLLTRAQAVGIDGHFVIEQRMRHHLGAFLNFNGTAGIWRRVGLDHAGGWQGDTLTEDLDLSYRLQLKGWRIAYLPEVIVPAELPVQLYALKRQQFRWAKGSIQTAIKLWKPLWRSPSPLWRKVLASFHLTQYAVHPLMLLNLLLIWPVLQSETVLLSLTPLVTIAAIGPPMMYWLTMEAQGMSWPRRIGRLGSLLALGTGLSVNNSWAVLQALLGIESEFKRTPKFAIVNRSTRWQASSYALSGGWLIWLEALLGVYACLLASYSIQMAQWGLLPWLVLYGSGYILVIGIALGQVWQQNQATRSQSAPRLKAE